MVRPVALLRASHPGPTVAVTVVTALIAVGTGHGLARGGLVTAAVLAGQLSIGWSNDVVDAARDRVVGRPDKPVAGGAVSERAVAVAAGTALAACVVLSFACGWRSALVHLLLGVASGWAYNLVLKRTLWSWVPYAVAFGCLPSVVTLALPEPVLAPPWVTAAGSLLGVGAHLLNALPDLDDDARTGVRALPHALGAAKVRVLAPLVLLAGSVVVALGRGLAQGWPALAVSLVLAGVAVLGRGKVPFLAAIGIALVDVATLALAS